MKIPFWSSPDTDDAAAAVAAVRKETAIPIIWLLGKTGAGKSSLIRALTGLTQAEVGNGFVPCTRTSQMFDFPAGLPLVRFLDTRGLGEAGYNPKDDIAACSGHAHVVLALARLDDPVQGEVAEALADVMQRDRVVILVLTGADLIADANQRDRAIRATQAVYKKAAGRDLPFVTIALPEGGAAPQGLEPLIEMLAEVLPDAARSLTSDAARDAEQRQFQALRGRVMFYASLAGASDLAPLVGVLSVPAAQAAMLRELGQAYDFAWTRATSGAFLATLGVGIAARTGVMFGLRQIGKLIPVYGQTAVAAASGTVSFATTFALGRAAAYYLFHRSKGDDVNPQDLQAIYRDALKGARRGKD